MNEGIRHYASQQEALVARSLKQTQRKSVKIVGDQLGKRLFSYFMKWKQSSSGIEVALRTKVSGLVIRTYHQYLRAYFELWRKSGTKKAIKKKKKMIMELTTSTSTLENESIKNENISKVQVEGVRSIQQKQQNKIMKKYMKRVYENAFNRWRDQISHKNTAYSNTDHIIKRMRKKLLRQAFGKYKTWYQAQVQFDEHVKESEELIHQYTLRRMKVVYDSWLMYV